MKVTKLKVLILTFLVFSPVLANANELPTAPYVDIEKYIGKWYEIAAIPQLFQAGCAASTAEYEFGEDETISVKNSCFNYYLNRDVVATASARVVDPETNAKLKVAFFGPEGDYWILDLAADYSWAIVGEPNRESLWILSRKPQMDSGLYNLLIQRIEEKFGYDTSEIKIRYQPAIKP